MVDAILGNGSGPAAADLIKEGSTATFMADVIDGSKDQAVIVDFWAPWCGPCKQLGPALEKAVKDQRGAVKLVKINVDENQELAAQMRIQSIPAVYAFKGGRPVDGFVGALPESQIKQFVGKLAGGAAGPSPIEEALAAAKEAIAAGDQAQADDIYTQILEAEPDQADALAGLTRSAIARKDFEAAKAHLHDLPPAVASHAEIQAARAALELAEAGEKAQGATGELEARLKADPKDHQARLDLAVALFAAGERERAVDELLFLVKTARTWNEEAARKQLVKFFEALGHMDPLTVDTRKRLSSILFS
ncbi:MAG: thioredoxin [Stellaceae bacterium]